MLFTPNGIANRGDVFHIGNHEFDARDVCSNGSFNRKDWNGPPRWHLQVRNRMCVCCKYLFCWCRMYTYTSHHLYIYIYISTLHTITFSSAQIQSVGGQFI